ncbi:hsp70-Hsp90 organizing protein 1-like [Hibiscus syriacus]|uniref:hsp70-Hsp90 organizing protein 1-like n=1 Tax=Hibiscus syriacus TaxID=106335 RepID=UPI001924E768|nr:hsp70-Hsp90 organizing protein 1-like [Hibiscus syriacus]
MLEIYSTPCQQNQRQPQAIGPYGAERDVFHREIDVEVAKRRVEDPSAEDQLYTESLRRNPKDPKAYSNGAACYTKLGALPEGLKDAEKCIELDPTFSKGYTRKGAVQFFMKEYDRALETYQEGLEHDPNNQELLDGVRRCVEQINKASRGDLSPEELKERQARAMQDPEIQNILSDPVMRQVLTDFQENAKAAQEHTKNPMVMNKIQKQTSAGIVQMR